MTEPSWLPPMPWSVQRARCFTWAEKLALVILWGRADSSGKCLTSLPVLALDMPASLGAARAAIKGLGAKGVVTSTLTGRGIRCVVHTEVAERLAVLSRPIGINQADLSETVYRKAAERDRPIESDTSDLSETTSRPIGINQADLSETIPKEVPIRITQKEEPRRIRSARQTTGPPTVSDAFRKRMAVKYGDTLGAETTAFQIDLCLGYKTTKNHANTELAVQNWLNKEVERMPRKGAGNAATRGTANRTNGYDDHAVAPDVLERLRGLGRRGPAREAPTVDLP